METQENTVPTIAQLWDRLQKLGNYIETEKILRSWGTKGSDGLSHDGRDHAKDYAELQSLRQQLLERVETEWGMEIREVKRNGVPEVMVIFEHGKLFLNAEDADDLGSCLKFGAWELEQRELEKQSEK